MVGAHDVETNVEHLAGAQGVRIDLMHGRADSNLGIAAAQSLRDALVAEDADVRWSPFEGGHEIPLQAWVGLRRLVRELATAD